MTGVPLLFALRRCQRRRHLCRGTGARRMPPIHSSLRRRPRQNRETRCDCRRTVYFVLPASPAAPPRNGRRRSGPTTLGGPLTPAPLPGGEGSIGIGGGGLRMRLCAHPWRMAARCSAPKMCARENAFNRGTTGGCAEASAQIWKSRAGKCLTVSKNRRHNGVCGCIMLDWRVA